MTKIDKAPEIINKLSQENTSTVEPNFSELPSRKKSGHFLPIYVAVFIVVMLPVSMAILFFLNEPSVDENVSTNEPDQLSDEEAQAFEESESDVSDLDEEKVEPGIESDQNRILYIKDNNIWVINPDGTNKTQLTSDGDGLTVTYHSLAWQSAGVASYSKCADSCKVYTRDLATDAETEIIEGAPFTQSIDAIEWSHDGTTLGYLFTKGDYSKEVSLWTTAGTTVLKSYAPPPGRGGHYDDGMEIIFSPDDSRVLVLNTIIDETYDNPVMFFEVDGTLITELADATFPTFDGNDAFYYKSTSGGSIDRWSESTGSSSAVTTFSSVSIHNLHTSPDGYFVLFWSNVGETNPTQAYYDTGGSSSAISTGFIGGKWIDESSMYVIAQEISGTIEMGPFNVVGLSKINRTDGTSISLDTGWISTYVVE